jgi:hypothetical protein
MSQATAADCPLPAVQQTRNLLIYGANVGLVYLCAPVLYLAVQPALAEKLGASKTVSNLPSTVYFWMTPLPIVVAWLFPRVRHLKPVLAASYLSAAAMGGLVAFCLWVPTPGWALAWIAAWNARVGGLLVLPGHWAVPAMIAHALVLGGALGVVSTFQWEMVGRGVSEARRGQALGLAFGCMPLLAMLGSAASDAILARPRWEGYQDFAVVFGSTIPAMAAAALLATALVVPKPAVEVAREPFVTAVFGGIGQFLSHRPIVLASLAMILVGSGYNIITNITLYTQEAIGAPAEDYVGEQGMLRFGFKVAAGLALGWLLPRTNPKLPALIVAGFLLAGPAWALFAPPALFLASFGLMGAGELFGVYFPNYILTSSPPSRMRRNMAFTSMLNWPCAPAAVAYGAIADRHGIPASLWTAVGVMTAAILLVALVLPARPRPRAADLDLSDRGDGRSPAGG